CAEREFGTSSRRARARAEAPTRSRAWGLPGDAYVARLPAQNADRGISRRCAGKNHPTRFRPTPFGGLPPPTREHPADVHSGRSTARTFLALQLAGTPAPPHQSAKTGGRPEP